MTVVDRANGLYPFVGDQRWPGGRIERLLGPRDRQRNDSHEDDATDEAPTAVEPHPEPVMIPTMRAQVPVYKTPMRTTRCYTGHRMIAYLIGR